MSHRLQNLRTAALVAAFVFVGGCPDGEPSHPDVADDAHDDLGSGDTSDVSDVVDPEPPPPTTPAACGFPGAVTPPEGVFVDHTIPTFDGLACYYAFATPDRAFDPDAEDGSYHRDFTIKFTVSGFLGDAPAIVFYSNAFYKLHDEWYWFRLLNGERVPGVDDTPVSGTTFPTIAAIYAALATANPLPLDLVFIGATAGTFAGRLYSPRFYSLAGLAAPATQRVFGVGSMLHFPPREGRVRPERIHAFQLEYGETPTPLVLARYLEILRANLPPEIGDRLRWLARSPTQEALALSLKAAGGLWADRILTFADLAAPGAYEAYHLGITAGFVRIVGPDEPVGDLRPDEIAILARVPDDIPPVRAIVSDVPQTPLAHVALLAEARDTPNAWLSGVASDGRLAEWAWQRRPVIVSVSREGVVFKPITTTEYSTWQSRLARPSVDLVPIETPDDHPPTIDLDPAPARRTDVPLIGGKSAGLTSFYSGPEVPIPPWPLAVTIRPYAAWFAPLSTQVEALVAHAGMADRLIRFALLEGPTAFRATFATDAPALAHFDRWLAANGEDPVIKPIIDADGLQAWLRLQPIPLEVFRSVRLALEARFTGLSYLQGLRFRSSSTVEDIPGFNGAGLYRSTTGFLQPQLQPGSGDRTRTIEAALREVWSSYWNYYAFNEREGAGIDHFDGRMAVLVHPRFDDALERANLVMTLSCNQHDAARPCRLVINAQPGAMSVTNPGGGLAVPEVTVVAGVRDEAPTFERAQASSAMEPGTWVVAEDDALSLYANARLHLEAWLAEDNAARPASERSRSLTLDYELKWMAPGWPRLADSSVAEQRFIWRQARVLDQPPRVAPAPDPWLGPTFPTTALMPVDLNPLATRLDVRRCRRDDLELRFYTLRTSREDMPGGQGAWVYKAYLRALAPLSGFQLPTQGLWIPHTGFAQVIDGAKATLTFDATHAEILRLDSLALELAGPNASAVLSRGATTSAFACTTVEDRNLFADASEYLRGLLAAEDPR